MQILANYLINTLRSLFYHLGMTNSVICGLTHHDSKTIHPFHIYFGVTFLYRPDYVLQANSREKQSEKERLRMVCTESYFMTIDLFTVIYTQGIE